jgi:hypothetical protein
MGTLADIIFQIVSCILPRRRIVALGLASIVLLCGIALLLVHRIFEGGVVIVVSFLMFVCAFWLRSHTAVIHSGSESDSGPSHVGDSTPKA